MEQDYIWVVDEPKVSWDDSTYKIIPKCHIMSLNTLSTFSIVQRKPRVVAIGFPPLQDNISENQIY